MVAPAASVAGVDMRPITSLYKAMWLIKTKSHFLRRDNQIYNRTFFSKATSKLSQENRAINYLFWSACQSFDYVQYGIGIRPIWHRFPHISILFWIWPYLRKYPLAWKFSYFVFFPVNLHISRGSSDFCGNYYQTFK